MSRQLSRLTDAATSIEHNPIWRRIPAGILQLITIEHNPIWRRIPAGILQLITGAIVFVVVYGFLNFIY